MVTSEALIEELKDVISRPKFTDRLLNIGETVDSLLESDYRTLVEIVEPVVVEPTILKDADDDALIACAIAGAAEFIVSGDHHLLELGTVHGIKICTASQFMEQILRG